MQSPMNISPKLANRQNPLKLSNLARLTTTPHQNFISLRSGSESAYSNGFLRPGVSCDYENNSDYNLDSSLSLTHHHSSSSQYLQPPSASNANSPTHTTSNNSNFNLQPHSSRSITPVEINEPVPLPTSQRPINPMSSLRRHMFVNSRRNAQTTVDHSHRMMNYTQDSMCDEYQVYGGGMGFDHIQMNSISIQSPKFMQDRQSPFLDNGQIMTSFIETIDECNADGDLNQPLDDSG
jgi:hypothetical protein